MLYDVVAITFAHHHLKKSCKSYHDRIYSGKKSTYTFSKRHKIPILKLLQEDTPPRQGNMEPIKFYVQDHFSSLT